MTLGDIIRRLLELLGLKSSDAKKYEVMEQKFRADRALNVDRLEALKDQIATLERQAKAKKKEYDAAAGDTKRVVAGEIQRILGDLDHLQRREVIIGRNIEKLGLAVAKVAEMRDAKAQGVDEDVFDDISVDYEDIVTDLKATDRAAADAEKVAYTAPKGKDIDVASRMADLEGQSESSTESAGSLSAATLDRLNEIAGEEG
jgi:hypothetical protein